MQKPVYEGSGRKLERTRVPSVYKRGGRYVVVYRDPQGRQRKRSARTLYTLGSTRYHFLMRKTAVTMEDYEQAANAKANAMAKADELLDEIRRSWPRWLRLLKWPRRRNEAPAV